MLFLALRHKQALYRLIKFLRSTYVFGSAVIARPVQFHTAIASIIAPYVLTPIAIFVIAYVATLVAYDLYRAYANSNFC